MNDLAKRKRIFILIICLLIVLWLCSMLVKATRTEGSQVLISEGSYYSCSQGWYDDAGNIYNMDKIDYNEEDLGKEHIYHYKIPYNLVIGEGFSICFFSRGLDYKVYATADEKSTYYGSKDLGSRPLYEFHQNGAGMTGTDTGLVLQTVPISKTDIENEITLSITPTEVSAFIIDMRIQDASDFILGTIRSRMLMLIESVVIMFFGLFTILYTAFAVENDRKKKTMVYAWGWQAFVVGVLLIIQTQVIQILTGKPEFCNAIKYMLGLLLAFPTAVQVDATAKHPHRHFSFVIGIIVGILIFFESAVSFFLDISLYRLFFVSSLPLLLFCVVMGIIYFFKDLKYSRTNPETRYSVYLLGVVVILGLSSIIDFGLYAYAGKHMTDWGRIIRTCYTCFVPVFTALSIRNAIKRNREARLAATYRLQARTDAMTGLLNKGAYISREDELTIQLLQTRQEGKELFSFVIMSLDLNNLKLVNDTLGHEMGDEYIKAAARIFTEAVGSKGELYRVGGDEFLVLIFGTDPEQTYREIVGTIKKKTEEFNSKTKGTIPLNFAYGHALCTSEQNYSIHDSERIADAEMYEQKRQMKTEIH